MKTGASFLEKALASIESLIEPLPDPVKVVVRAVLGGLIILWILDYVIAFFKKGKKPADGDDIQNRNDADDASCRAGRGRRVQDGR